MIWSVIHLFNFFKVMLSSHSSQHACSSSEIVKLISSDTYDKLIQDNTIKAIFYVNDNLSLNLNSYFKNQKCVLTFVSTINKSDGKIMWKSSDQDDFTILKISNDDEECGVLKICQNFIFSELKNDRNG